DRAPAVERALVALIRRERHESGLASSASDAAAPPIRRIYCGTSRVTSGPLQGAVPGKPQTFTALFRYQEQGRAFTPYPVGRWTPSAEGLTSARGGPSDFL